MPRILPSNPFYFKTKSGFYLGVDGAKDVVLVPKEKAVLFEFVYEDTLEAEKRKRDKEFLDRIPGNKCGGFQDYPLFQPGYENRGHIKVHGNYIDNHYWRQSEGYAIVDIGKATVEVKQKGQYIALFVDYGSHVLNPRPKFERCGSSLKWMQSKEPVFEFVATTSL